MKKQFLDEMNRSIEAHHAWLAGEGIQLTANPATMTALDTLHVIETAKVDEGIQSGRRIVAVITALQRLCAFRTRAVGMESSRKEIERRLRALEEVRPARGEKTEHKRKRAELKALLVSRDDRDILVIETRARLAQKNLRSLRSAITKRSSGIAISYKVLRNAGWACVAAPALARSRVEIILIQAALEQFYSTLDWFVSRLRGAASSAPLGYDGELSDKNWRQERNQCLALLKENGVANKLQQQLYPSDSTEPRPDAALLTKERNQKRRSRAKLSAKSES